MFVLGKLCCDCHVYNPYLLLIFFFFFLVELVTKKIVLVVAFEFGGGALTEDGVFMNQ